MFCTACGAENLKIAKFCRSCGAPIPAEAEPIPQASQPTEDRVVQKPSLSWWAMPAIVLPVIFAFSQAAVRSDISNAEKSGYAVGMLLIPVIVAVIVARRKQTQKWNTFAKTFFWVSLFFVGVNATRQRTDTSAAKQYSSNQWIGRLAKQAAGKLPLDNSYSPFPKQANDIFREMFKDIINVSKAQNARLNTIRELDELYSAKSFASVVEMTTMKEQVQHISDSDSKTWSDILQVVSDTKTRIYSSSLSQQTKDELWHGFMEGFDKSLSTKQTLMQAEKDWCDSTQDLYDVAIANSSEIVVRKEKLFIRRDAVRDTFNQKLNTAVARHKRVVDLFNTSQAARQKWLTNAGLSPADLGEQQQ